MQDSSLPVSREDFTYYFLCRRLLACKEEVIKDGTLRVTHRSRLGDMLEPRDLSKPLAKRIRDHVIWLLFEFSEQIGIRPVNDIPPRIVTPKGIHALHIFSRCP